jgi:hypothetical protein
MAFRPSLGTLALKEWYRNQMGYRQMGIHLFPIFLFCFMYMINFLLFLFKV